MKVNNSSKVVMNIFLVLIVGLLSQFTDKQRTNAQRLYTNRASHDGKYAGKWTCYLFDFTLKRKTGVSQND